MPWIKVSGLLGTEQVKSVQLGGKRICLVRHQGRYYATQMKCPHAGADLSHGWCKEGFLVCPYHRHEFNLENGRGLPEQGNYIDTYPVEERADGVYVFKEEKKSLFSKLFGN